MNKAPFRMMSLLLCYLGTQATLASDACLRTAITAHADVTVSDGKTYGVQTHYRSPQEASLSFLRDDPAQMVIEGPTVWVRSSQGEQAGTAFHKLFVLGHQYHALLLHFDEIMTEITETSVDWNGEIHTARSGNIPHGGTATLVGSDRDQPAGMRFDYPDIPRIDVQFDDWRPAGNRELPWHVHIDDGSRQFNYRYDSISVDDASPLWFMESVTAPELDEILVHRLHRQMMAAHCLGDASLISTLSSDSWSNTDGGALSFMSPSDIEQRFIHVFDQVEYTGYVDLVDPHIEIAQSGDMGWVQANVLTQGRVRASDAAFEHTWAWTMLVRKHEGQWLNAGMASSRRQ